MRRFSIGIIHLSLGLTDAKQSGHQESATPSHGSQAHLCELKMQALRLSWRRCLPNALDSFAIGLTNYLHMLAFSILNTDWLVSRICKPTERCKGVISCRISLASSGDRGSVNPSQNIPYRGSRRRYAATCSTIRRCGKDNNEGGKGREDTLPSEYEHHSWNPIEESTKRKPPWFHNVKSIFGNRLHPVSYATLLQTSTQFLERTGLNLQTIVCCTTALLFSKPAYRMKQQRKPHHLKPPHQTFFFSPPCSASTAGSPHTHHVSHSLTKKKANRCCVAEQVGEKVLQAFIWTACRLRERGSRRRIGIANLFLAAFPFRVYDGRLIKPG
ncbi:hypothetical protein GE21DRAFT_1312056 [Neurospora crassa]|nr:hypothetical protein GE21DRAFT_1312056 [Neurospora crassa]